MLPTADSYAVSPEFRCRQTDGMTAGNIAKMSKL